MNTRASAHTHTHKNMSSRHATTYIAACFLWAWIAPRMPSTHLEARGAHVNRRSIGDVRSFVMMLTQRAQFQPSGSATRTLQRCALSANAKMSPLYR
jgi:hypothetical protein